jgi:YHS domain-containing protein
MNIQKVRRSGVLLATAVVAVSFAGSAAHGGTPEAQPVAATSTAKTERVASRVTQTSQVCMVNDRFMSVEQIPVEVEGKTYYGCCAMCKDRLARDKAVREAKDPVSGATVDKAKAVMGRLPSGEIVYFENARNLERYNQSLKSAAGRKG